ncbi:unnamed protein product, partial [Prorocentrum cordatum]
ASAPPPPRGGAALEGWLREAERELCDVRDGWSALPEPGGGAEELRSREAAVRSRLRACELGDPAATDVVRLQPSGDPLVAAHGAVTRALLEVELAQERWGLRDSAASPPEAAGLASALVRMAALRHRLADFTAAYGLLQRALAMGVDPSADPWLLGFVSNTAMCQALREPGSMAGLDVSPDGPDAAALRRLRAVLLEEGYSTGAVLQATGADSLCDFSDEDRHAELEEALDDADEEPLPAAALADLIRFFLLRRAIPLQRLRGLISEKGRASEAARRVDEADCGGLACFANVRIWPVEEDLLVATDVQTWPSEGFEPVMYISDDSLGLASVTPRGSVYEALPPGSGPFDGIIANPPFLPNPQGIASQAIAMFGNGGDFGEDVFAAIVRGAAGG